MEVLKTQLEKCEKDKNDCVTKIRSLQDVVTSKEEKIEDLEYNLEESTQIITSNYNKIQVLESSNTDLKNDLEKQLKNSMMPKVSLISNLT